MLLYPLGLVINARTMCVLKEDECADNGIGTMRCMS